MKKVVIIDDSLFMRQSIRTALVRSGRFCIVGEARNGELGIDLALELQPDIITLDSNLPDMPGAEVINELRMAGFFEKIILISGFDKETNAQEAKFSGADAYISKPFSHERLIETIDKMKASIHKEKIAVLI